MAGTEVDTTGKAYWSWFPSAIALAGIIGFIFATFGPPASSSGFVTAIKGLLGFLAPDYFASKQHYAMMPGAGSWLMTFVLGMAIGGQLGALASGGKPKDVPTLWVARFGEGRAKRYVATFLGGVLLLFGARLAGGCTLGLFISGSTQLAVAGLYFGVVIFAVAMVTARMVYGKAVIKANRQEVGR